MRHEGYPVLFKGGPIGGETAMVQRLDEPYRVPTCGGPIVRYADDTTIPCPISNYEVERYVFSGERDRHGNYIFRWENPAPALRSLLREAEDKLRRVQRVLTG